MCMTGLLNPACSLFSFLEIQESLWHILQWNIWRFRDLEHEGWGYFIGVLIFILPSGVFFWHIAAAWSSIQLRRYGSFPPEGVLLARNIYIWSVWTKPIGLPPNHKYFKEFAGAHGWGGGHKMAKVVPTPLYLKIKMLVERGKSAGPIWTPGGFMWPVIYTFPTRCTV